MEQPDPAVREGYAPGWEPAALSMMERRTAGDRAGFALPLLAGALRVVDVGCGPGTITVGLAQAAPAAAVVGVDREASQVDLARDTARAAGVTNLEIRQASAYALPVPGGGVDVVFSHALFEHLADPAAALAECARVLRPGGVVALACSDWSRAELDPYDADVEQALAGHYLLRRRAGGDPFRGGALADVVTAAGFVEVVARRVDRVDMAYDDFGRWVAGLLHAALADPDTRAEDRRPLRAAADAADRWASRRGRFVQCWVEVVGRKAASCT